MCDRCLLLVCRINAAHGAVELDPGLVTEIKTHGPVLLVEHRAGCAEGVGQNDVRIVELLRLYLVDVDGAGGQDREAMLRNVLWWPATTSSRATNCVARKGFVGAQGSRLAVARTDSARSMCTQLQGAALARLWKASRDDLLC